MTITIAITEAKIGRSMKKCEMRMAPATLPGAGGAAWPPAGAAPGFCAIDRLARRAPAPCH